MSKVEKTNLDNFEPTVRIVVLGVGGAGNNAVNRMIDEKINNVEFYVLNTDKQALSISQASNRIVLGKKTTGGLGAGGNPEIGREAAEESADEIKKIVEGAQLVFIAAGMGGGTGTGAAPVIARIARDAGALTVAIVTRPFTIEGKTRIANSVKGLSELRDVVDSIIIVSNDKLLLNAGSKPVNQSFFEADSVLSQSVKTVTDLILMPATINLDFADVRNVLKKSGMALIGFGMGQGPNKTIDAAQDAVSSPLLESSLNGATKAIVAVTTGTQVSLFEALETVERIREIANTNLDIKFSVSHNEQLTDQILVSIIAASFTTEKDYTTVPPISISKPKNETDNGLLNAAQDKNNPKDEEDGGLLPEFLNDKRFN